MRGEIRSDPTDAAIAALADRQHGVVSRRQLAALAVDRHAIDRRVSRRLLAPLHRGVFAVGHRQLRVEGRWLAAVLAAGTGAVLSHRDAAALHGMRKAPESRKVSVTTAGDVRSTPQLCVYARRRLAADEVEVVRAIPVTSPARTIVDLAPMLTAAQLASMLGEGDRKGLLDPVAVQRALRRTKGRHGQGHQRLRAALDVHARAGATLTRSELEECFLDLILSAGLPRPRLNAPAAGYEVDALWPAERVVVELDGWANHSDRAAASRDRAKTNRLQLQGFAALRFLHGDLATRPADVVAAVQAALAAAHSTSTVSSCE
jgi:very-short-patch-repair endonuclease